MAGVRSDSGSRRGARPNILCDHILWHHGDPARISDPRGGGLGGGRTPPATARSRPRANRDSVAGTRREAGDSLRLARSRRCRWPERSRSDLDRRLTGAVPRALPPFLRDARAKGRDGHPRLHSRRVRSHAPRPPSPSLPHVRPSSRTRASTASRRPRKRSRHFSTLGAPNTSWDIRSRISPPNARSSTRRSCRSPRGRRPSTSFTCPLATRTPCRAVCLLTRLPARTPSARSTWPAR